MREANYIQPCKNQIFHVSTICELRIIESKEPVQHVKLDTDRLFK